MVDAVKNYFLSRVPSCLPRLGNGVTTSNTERTCLNTHSTNTLTQFPTERLCRALSTQATLVSLVIATPHSRDFTRIRQRQFLKKCLYALDYMAICGS